jgi:hypothetical protein
MSELAVRDSEVQVIVDTGANLLLEASTLTIETDQHVAEATQILGFIANNKKGLEEKRKALVGPLNDQVKQINDAFKTFVGPLDQADQIIRRKVMDYRAEVERQRRAEEARLREIAAKEQAKQEKQAAKKGIEPPAPIIIPTLENFQPKTVKTDMGTASIKEVWEFEIADEAAIPREYLAVDVQKIRAVVKAGVRSIPGVRIFKTEQLAVRAR